MTFQKAIAYEKNDLTQEAIKIMTTLLSKDPDFIQGYFYLQSLYENEKIIQMRLKQVKKGYVLINFIKNSWFLPVV